MDTNYYKWIVEQQKVHAENLVNNLGYSESDAKRIARQYSKYYTYEIYINTLQDRST